MIKLNGETININHFPDGTLLLKQDITDDMMDYYVNRILWCFENNEELVALIFLVKHLRENGIRDITLYMPYLPNARQDRAKNTDDVFTLKYFAEIINSLHFKAVYIKDPHSYVSEALIDRVVSFPPSKEIEYAIEHCSPDMLFYPDEGAMKRYSLASNIEYIFGLKKRDWSTGRILGLDVIGDIDKIKNSKILIIDDICSRGGTFYHSATKLKELGAKEIYLYVTHCENTIFEGELLTTDLIKRIYTTDSILTKVHDKIEVIDI